MAKNWVCLFDEMDQALSYAGGDWEAVRGLLGGKGRTWRKWFTWEYRFPRAIS